LKYKKLASLIFFILVSSTLSSAQNVYNDNAELLFKKVIDSYKELRDYTVDMEAIIEMQGVSVPEMKAKIYYKRPNKVSIRSDDFILLPKKAAIFDPTLFGLDSLDKAIFKFLSEEGSGDELTKKYSVRPDPNKPDSMILWLDPNKYVIRKVERNLRMGGKLLVEFQYIHTGEFFLPSMVTVSMDIPQSLLDLKDGSPLGGLDTELEERISGFEENAKGFVRIIYSNYVVNKGISDDQFRKSPFIK